MFANAFRTQVRLAVAASRPRTLTTHATLSRCLRPVLFSQTPRWGSRFLSASPFAAAEAEENSTRFEVTDMSDADARRTSRRENAPSSVLFVSNIPYSITDTDLMKKFDVFGEITAVRLAIGSDGRPRGFGHLHFANKEDAVAAYESAIREPIFVLGRELRMEYGRPTQALEPSKKLHFSSFDGGEADIRRAFGEHGDGILDVFFLKSQQSGDYTGAGFVEFPSVEEATEALEVAREAGLKVNYARPRNQGQRGPGSQQRSERRFQRRRDYD